MRKRETPDAGHVEPHVVKEGRKPRVGADGRDDDEDGVPVFFADK